MFGKNKDSQRRFTPLKVVFFIALFFAVAAALSWLVMLLWNAILPDVAGVKALNFWQAAGLLLLSRILFGGFGRGKGPRKHARKSHWKSKWMAMNTDERQEAKARWEAYCERREESRMEKE